MATSPEMSSSFLGRLTMWWFNSICVKGKKKPLETSDLYALNRGDQAGYLVPRWFDLWDKKMEGEIFFTSFLTLLRYRIQCKKGRNS